MRTWQARFARCTALCHPKQQGRLHSTLRRPLRDREDDREARARIRQGRHKRKGL